MTAAERAWRARNPERVRLYRRRWYLRHAEEHKANMRAYRARARAAGVARDGGQTPGGTHGTPPADAREGVTPGPGVLPGDRK